MESFYSITGLSLSNLVLLLISLGWLFYRVQKVLQTPVDDLIRLLGLEVPVAPVATLVDIASRSVAIQWKSPEQRALAVKHAVKVNGVDVGEVPSHESAVSVVNLKPGHFYVIRVIGINGANFRASGELLRVRTREECAANGIESTDDAGSGEDSTPSLAPFKPLTECLSTHGSTSGPTREHSGSISHSKRINVHRRPSPAAQSESTVPFDGGTLAADAADTVSELASKLDIVRRDIDELERQDEDEERQFEAMQLSLSERREHLRQQLKERDDESNDLKKNVTSLERQNTAVQTRKSKQERLLTQRKSERDRFREEMSRWQKEIKDFQKEVVQMSLDREECLSTIESQLQSLRQEQDVDLQLLKGLEERLVETRRDIKDLEEEQDTLHEDPNDAMQVERQRRAKQEDFEWSDKLSALQGRYQIAWNACNQAQASFTHMQRRVDYLNTRQNSQAAQFGPHFPDASPIPSESSVGATVAGARSSVTTQEHNRMPSLSNRPLPGRLTFQGPSPFVNSSDPITAPSRSPLHEGMTEAEAELLTGGALTSPSAGALLPFGLFGDDAEEARPNESSPTPYLPGLGADPGPNSPVMTDEPRAEVTSPLSPDSHSPSAVSSPHGSVSNFHQYRLSDGRMDSDRRSTRSTSSSTKAPPRRFVDFFSLQRARAASNEGLPLGSLNTFESRSLPMQKANIAEGTDEDKVDGKKGVSTGGLFGSMSQAFRLNNASNKVPEENEDETEVVAPSRPAAFGLWGLRGNNNIWATARTSSPRPASTYSNYSLENTLPLPTGDNQPFGWPANDTIEQQPSTRQGSVSYPWSLSPSRRQSIQPLQHQSSLSLNNIGGPEYQDLPIEQTSPPQAPIGTKPSKFRRDSPQKQLNPNARDFRSILTRPRGGERSKKSESTRISEDDSSIFGESSSPSESRKSRDNRNSLAAESADDMFEEQLTQGSSPAKSTEGAKESFMRKMTRKGSSSKFSLSSSLKEKSGSLFSRKGASSDEVEEEITGITLAKTLDSGVSTDKTSTDKRGILASFKRRGKKGTDTPSISEASMASETGDEGDDRPSADFDER